LQDLIARELLEQLEVEVAGVRQVGHLAEEARSFLLKAIEAAYEHGFYDGAACAMQDGEAAFDFDEPSPPSSGPPGSAASWRPSN
jgi:hypothetical protein